MLSLLAYDDIPKRVENGLFRGIFGLSEGRITFFFSLFIMKVTSKQKKNDSQVIIACRIVLQNTTFHWCNMINVKTKT